MPSCGKVACCLLLISLLHVAMSINLKALCEHRCLHGMGGALCGCNAFHFSGKRSDNLKPSANHLYGTVDLQSRYDILEDESVNSADRKDFDQFLSGLGHERAFDTSEHYGFAGTRLPSLAFPSMRAVALNGDETGMNTREKVASEIRQIMSQPFERASSREMNDASEDLLSKNLEEHSLSDDHSGRNLMKLEKVLTQALQGR